MIILINGSGCIKDDEQKVPVVDGWLQYQSYGNDYRVKEGDTLYSIAWDFGLDYRVLAAVNNLHPPYHVTPGSMLKMTAQTDGLERTNLYNGIPSATPKHRNVIASQTTMQTRQATGLLKQQNTYQASQIIRSPQSSSSQVSLVEAPAFKSTVSNRSISIPMNKQPSLTVTQTSFEFPSHIKRWLWPTQGKIIEGYSKALAGNHGLNIAGVLGQTICASAAGEVVYSGTGVRGYGNLIIIKHNSNYLSAYAYNKRIFVRLGQKVQAGQEIATMGRGEGGLIMLHFEIRFYGQPVNPIILLR